MFPANVPIIYRHCPFLYKAGLRQNRAYFLGRGHHFACIQGAFMVGLIVKTGIRTTQISLPHENNLIAVQKGERTKVSSDDNKGDVSRMTSILREQAKGTRRIIRVLRY